MQLNKEETTRKNYLSNVPPTERTIHLAVLKTKFSKKMTLHSVISYHNVFYLAAAIHEDSLN
jgi:hypothetical protein